MKVNSEILIETQIDDAEWITFIQKCPVKEIFQTPYLRNVFEKTKNYQSFSYFARDKNNQIVASLLGYTIKENVPLSYFSRRALALGGPLFFDNKIGRMGANLLLERFNNDMKKHAIFAEIRNNRPTEGFSSIYTHAKFEFIEHLNIIIDLTQKEDLIWKGMHKSKRTGIKRAIKRGVTEKRVENESEMKELYHTLKQTYKHIKIPLADESLFIAILHELIPKNLAQARLFQLKNETIAGKIVLLFEGKIHSWYAGWNREYSRYNPNEFGTWKILQWGCINNYKVFDFGGAGKPTKEYGVRDYKMQFGGKLVNFGRYQSFMHPYYYKLSELGFNLWRKFFSRF